MASSPPPIPQEDGTAASDRRNSDRLTTRLRVDYCHLAHCDGAATLRGSQRAVATNISATGFLLSGAKELDVGHLLHLTLRLPDMPGNTVTCDAKVVRRAEPRGAVGCRILQIHQWDSRRLADFVSRCARA